MIAVNINGNPFEVAEGTRIIDAVRDAGIDLPGICYKRGATGENVCDRGSCRMCQVDVDGRLATACEQTVRPGLKIQTNTPQARAAQQFALGTVVANHAGVCLECPANSDCSLRQLAGRFDISAAMSFPVFQGDRSPNGDHLFDLQTSSIEFDAALCIQCGRCVEVCPTGAMGSIGRGINRRMGPPPGLAFENICIDCGQCIQACPTGALVEKSSIAPVEAALSDPTKRVVFQIAPAVRVALGEAFGLPPGEIITGKIYAALRTLGVTLPPEQITVIKQYNGQHELVDKVLKTNVLVTDTNVTADLTIVEEAKELIDRIQNGGKLPVITSCCPAWIKYMEIFYPELREYVCSAKSPQQIMGALIKTYGAKTWNIDPQDLVTVSVMPCTAKKFEARRPEMNDSGYADVDFVLTTRELAQMLKTRGVNLLKLKDEKADYPFEEYTGAGTLFGNTGGVMEAALRTVHKNVTGQELEDIVFAAARGMESVKEATVKLNDLEVKVAVLHNLKGGHIQDFLDEIVHSTQDKNLAAVEIMACPGGCIGGGGQPKDFDWRTKVKRISGLNRDDATQRLRRSHESPVVKRIYEDYLEKPNGNTAHQLFHTHYMDRAKDLTSVKEPIK